MELLYEYPNGNTAVQLFKDGTKIRAWEDDVSPEPDFPESIDLKITGYCDLHRHCKWCHESSTPDGFHADPYKMIDLLSALPKGTELAIGGGNPLAFPDLPDFLASLRGMNLVPNLTVNALHLQSHWDYLMECLPFVFGVGVSYTDTDHIKDMIRRLRGKHDHLVLHVIAGVHQPEVLRDAQSLVDSALILGYKTYGRGEAYYSPGVAANIKRWAILWPYVATGLNVCFDNLALDQLKVQQRVPDGVWKEAYMGTDGDFSMYIDGPMWGYSRSSRETRTPIPDGVSIQELFQAIRYANRNAPQGI